MDSLMEQQVGGTHYTRFAVQPLEFGIKNRLIPVKMNVLKYVLRHPYKNGAEDLDKAIDYLKKHIHFQNYSSMDVVSHHKIGTFLYKNRITGKYRDLVITLLRAGASSVNYEKCINIINEIKKEEYGI